jgi:hypothetical protein
VNRPHDDDAWIGRATMLLDESVDNLDAATLSQLNRARQAALAAGRKRPARWAWGAGLAGAVAAVFGLAIGLHHEPEATLPPIAATPLQAGDIDLLTSDDDAIDLAENLDFYAWLEKQPDGPSG